MIKFLYDNIIIETTSLRFYDFLNIKLILKGKNDFKKNLEPLIFFITENAIYHTIICV